MRILLITFSVLFVFTCSSTPTSSKEENTGSNNNKNNSPPTIEQQSVFGTQYSNLSIALQGSDIDGDNLSYRIIDEVNNGSTILSDGTLIFSPNPGWHGLDSLSVSAYDGALYSMPAKIYINFEHYFSSSPIGYNKSANELRHSQLWLDYYNIPVINGLPLNGNIMGDAFFPYWYDAAVVIADFNGDGYEDLLHSKTGSDLATAEYPIELFLNDHSNENFIFDNTLIPNNAKNTTAREAAIGDFNNDGKPDVFYSPHGIHDGPGETPSMLISNETGYTFKRFDELQSDFYHNLTSGDINNDGLLDVILFGGGGGYNGVYTFFNNGDGNFTIDNNYLVNSTDGRLGGMWSTVLYDVNKDNNLDLVVAGGFDYAPFGDSNGNGTLIAILWGSGSAFDANNSTIVSTGVYPDEFCGDVVFYDIDSDGNDEIIARFADDGNTEEIKIFKHSGNFVYSDQTNEMIEDNSNSTGRSIVWLRAQDIDGDGNVDIFNSDKGNSNIGNVQHWEWDGTKMRRKSNNFFGLFNF